MVSFITFGHYVLFNVMFPLIWNNSFTFCFLSCLHCLLFLQTLEARTNHEYLLAVSLGCGFGDVFPYTMAEGLL